MLYLHYNLEIDSILMPPPSLPLRRSIRIKNQKIVSSIPQQKNWPAFRPVTNMCHFSLDHFGVGCGAISANHMPDYYNSLNQVI